MKKKKYNIYMGVCTDGGRVLLVNIYICLLFVDNNGVLLGIKFMFKNKNKNERIEILNKKEVKSFFIL